MYYHDGGRAVELSTSAAGGDSGAPHYHIEETYIGKRALIIGPHEWHSEYETSYGNDLRHLSSYAPPAFEIANQHDVSFYV